MIALVLCKLLLLGQIVSPQAQVLNEIKKEMAPTTQPAAVDQKTATDSQASDKGSVVETFKTTVVGRLLMGDKTMSPEEVTQAQTWINMAKELIWTLVGIIPRLLVALLFLFIFWLIHRGVRRLVVGSMKQGAVDSSIRDMLASMLKWLIMGFGLVIACNQVGIQITGLLTGVSLIGLAIGFAAQETLANFIAGIVIFWDKPFKVGDWIMVDGQYGQVMRISFRSTRILNGDGQMVVMPNTQMLAKQVSNHSTNPATRVRVPIGIAYKESIDAARKVILSTLKGDSRIAKDPEPCVVVVACADSSVNLELRFWTLDESLEGRILFEYLEKCKNALDAAGISIPFPHMQLLVEETPAVRTLAGGSLKRAG